MFKLDFQIPPSRFKINLSDKIFLAGSCFSESIGRKLAAFKFQQLHNPFGTLYNPVSIFKTVESPLTPDSIVESQGVFYHYDCHGSISGLTREEAVKKVEKTSQESSAFLAQSKYLLLTLGTSFVYRRKDSNEIVANCHKIPGAQFSKELLTVSQIVEAFSTMKESLTGNQKIILTVSPVRHIRDGLIDNNLGKAVLLESVHEIVKKYDDVDYFPAYEIMIDELRDYRFYSKDMIHPSGEAIDYIWSKFQEIYLDEETRKLTDAWSDLRMAIEHRPFQPESKKHQQFLQKTHEKVRSWKSMVDVSRELKTLESQMK